MAEEYFLEVRNWRKFQHYKDRNPPWIKLHYEVLSSKDWVMLDDAGKATMIACMLIASRNDGRVPLNENYIERVAYLKNVNLKPLIDIGFLTMLADASGCKQKQAEFRPETETETDADADHNTQPPIVPLGDVKEKRRRKPSGLSEMAQAQFERWYAVYPRREGTGAAEKAWGKHKFSDADVDAMIQKLELQKRHWNLKEPQYTPMPATYLNQKRWLDIVKPPIGEFFGTTSDDNTF